MCGIDTAERDLVVDSALAILERVGMRMKGARVLDALESRGAEVDRETGVVRMPAELVRAALGQLPDELFIAGATPEHDVVLDRRGGPFFNPSASHAKTLDFRTGRLRPSSLQDVREGTLVMDATPEIDVMWTFATANDVPVERRELVEYFTYLTSTSKPLVIVDCPTDATDMRRIADVLGGGLEGYRRRPRLGVLCAVRAPLAVNGALLDVTCEFAALGSPVFAYTMPMSGATGPDHRGRHARADVGRAPGHGDGRPGRRPGHGRASPAAAPASSTCTPAPCRSGAPRTPSWAWRRSRSATHLGLPVHNSALSTRRQHPGIQAGYEKGLKVLPAALAGVDLISGGFGALDFVQRLAPADGAHRRRDRLACEPLVAGSEITPETVMLDVIERVGVGGNYLKERVTRERVRAGEHFSPVIGSRLPFEQWMAEGRQETDVARERVEQIAGRRWSRRRPAAALAAQRRPAGGARGGLRRRALSGSRLRSSELRRPASRAARAAWPPGRRSTGQPASGLTSE